MKSGWRKQLQLFFLAILLSPVADAIELGSEQVYSFLNEPFLAEIELEDWQEIGLENIQIELGARYDFESFGIPYMPYLEDLRFAIEAGENGRAYILVTGRKPLKEPYLDFLVKARWPGGMIVREYVVLLDIPGFDPEPARQAQRPVYPDAAESDGAGLSLKVEGGTDAGSRGGSTLEGVSQAIPAGSSVLLTQSEASEPSSEAQDKPEIISRTFTAGSPAGDNMETGAENNEIPEAANGSDQLSVRTVQPEPDTLIQESAFPATEEPGEAVSDTPIESEPVTANLSQPSQSARLDTAGTESDAGQSATEVQAAIPVQQEAATVNSGYRVLPGDTLWGIASEFIPADSGVSVYQVMLGIYTSNMGSFVNRNFTLLKANQNLVIPDSSEMSRFSHSEAIDLINQLTENGQARFDALQRGLPLPEFTDFPVLVAENLEAAPDQPSTDSGRDTQLKPEIRQIPLERPPEPTENRLLTPVNAQAGVTVPEGENPSEAENSPEEEATVASRQLPVISDAAQELAGEDSNENSGMRQEATNSADVVAGVSTKLEGPDNTAGETDGSSEADPEEIVRLENLLAERQTEIFALEEQMQNMQVHLAETENTLLRLSERLEEQDATAETVRGAMTTLQRGGPDQEPAQPAGLLISPFMLKVSGGVLLIVLLAGSWMFWRKRQAAAAGEWEGLDDLDIPEYEEAEQSTDPANQSPSVSESPDAVKPSGPPASDDEIAVNHDAAGMRHEPDSQKLRDNDGELHFSAYAGLFSEDAEPEFVAEAEPENDFLGSYPNNNEQPSENLEFEGMDFDDIFPGNDRETQAKEAVPESESDKDKSAAQTDQFASKSESSPRSYSPGSGAGNNQEFSVTGGQQPKQAGNFEDILTEINLQVFDQAYKDEQDNDAPDITSLSFPPAEDDNKPSG